MKKVMIGLMVFSTVSVFAVEYKTNCTSADGSEIGGTIDLLIQKNIDGGFIEVVSTTSAPQSDYHMGFITINVCVTSKRKD